VNRWYNQKEDSLKTKEAITAQRLKEEKMEKRMQIQQKVQEQMRLTYFPPVKAKKGRKTIA